MSSCCTSFLKMISTELMNEISDEMVVEKLNCCKEDQYKLRCSFGSDCLKLLPKEDSESYSIKLLHQVQITEQMFIGFDSSSVSFNYKNYASSFFLVVKRHMNNVGFMCFDCLKECIVINWIFINNAERSKGLAGCLVSLLQDICIMTSKKILPIIIMYNNELSCIEMKRFHKKFYFIQGSNINDDKLLRALRNKYLCFNDSMTGSYFIQQIPMQIILNPTNNTMKFPSNFDHIIDVAREFCFGEKYFYGNFKAYSSVAKIFDILCHGKRIDKNRSNIIDIELWISSKKILEQTENLIGSQKELKYFLHMGDDDKKRLSLEVVSGKESKDTIWQVCSNFFYEYKNHFAFRFFLSMIFLLASKADVKQMNDSYNKYRQFFENVVKYIDHNMNNKSKLTKDNNKKSVYVNLSKIYLDENYSGTILEFCFIANIMKLDVIIVQPICYEKNLKNWLKEETDILYLWTLKKLYYHGRMQANKEVVFVYMASDGEGLIKVCNGADVNYLQREARKQYLFNSKLTDSKETELLKLQLKLHPSCTNFLEYLKGNIQNCPVIETLKDKNFRYPYEQWLTNASWFRIDNDYVTAKISKSLSSDTPIKFLESIQVYFASNLKMIEMLDVENDCIHDKKWSLEELINYFKLNKRQHIFNQVSLEISRMTGLRNQIQPPLMVKEVDWIDVAWNCSKEQKHPEIQCFLLTSVKYCYMDFHIDMNGSTVWYHIIVGRKTICLIKPTKDNLKLYKNWMLDKQEKKANNNFFKSFLPMINDKTTISIVKARKGDTIIIPSGTIHAVYTPEDSIVVGGNFFHSMSIPMQLNITKLEDDFGIDNEGRCPLFSSLCVCAVHHIYIKHCSGTALECEKKNLNLLIEFCKPFLLITCKKHYYFVNKEVVSIIRKAHLGIKFYFLFDMFENKVQYVPKNAFKNLPKVIDLVCYYYRNNTILNKMYDIEKNEISYDFLIDFLVLIKIGKYYAAIFICPVENVISKSVPNIMTDIKTVKTIHKLSEVSESCEVNVKHYESDSFNYHDEYCLFKTKKDAILGTFSFLFDSCNTKLYNKRLQNQKQNEFIPQCLQLSIISSVSKNVTTSSITANDNIMQLVRNQVNEIMSTVSDRIKKVDLDPCHDISNGSIVDDTKIANIHCDLAMAQQNNPVTDLMFNLNDAVTVHEVTEPPAIMLDATHLDINFMESFHQNLSVSAAIGDLADADIVPEVMVHVPCVTDNGNWNDSVTKHPFDTFPNVATNNDLLQTDILNSCDNAIEKMKYSVTESGENSDEALSVPKAVSVPKATIPSTIAFDVAPMDYKLTAILPEVVNEPTDIHSSCNIAMVEMKESVNELGDNSAETVTVPEATIPSTIELDLASLDYILTAELPEVLNDPTDIPNSCEIAMVGMKDSVNEPGDNSVEAVSVLEAKIQSTIALDVAPMDYKLTDVSPEATLHVTCNITAIQLNDSATESPLDALQKEANDIDNNGCYAATIQRNDSVTEPSNDSVYNATNGIVHEAKIQSTIALDVAPMDYKLTNVSPEATYHVTCDITAVQLNDSATESPLDAVQKEATDIDNKGFYAATIQRNDSVTEPSNDSVYNATNGIANQLSDVATVKQNDSVIRFKTINHSAFDKDWILTYPFIGGITIENNTCDLEYVHFHDYDICKEKISEYQHSWSPNKTRRVHLGLPEINRICNITCSGCFNDKIISFWTLWISRLSIKDELDVYFCPPNFYSKMTNETFNYQVVKGKCTCNIFEKTMIIVPICFGKYNWCICVIIHPYSYISAIKQKQGKLNLLDIHFENVIDREFEICIYEAYNKTQHSNVQKADRKNIFKNIMAWLQNEWLYRTRSKIPINEYVFPVVTLNDFNYNHICEISDMGVFICCVAKEAINLLLVSKKLDAKISIIQLSKKTNKCITSKALEMTRFQILFLMKELRLIQSIQEKNKTENTTYLDNYVEMSHIVQNCNGSGTSLNDVSYIQKYRKIQKFLKTVTFQQLNNTDLIKNALNKKKITMFDESNNNKHHPMIPKENDAEISLNSNIVGLYNVLNKKNIHIESYPKELQKEILDYHLKEMLPEEKDRFQMTSWKENLYGKFRCNFDDAKALMIKCHYRDIEKLQEMIISENKYCKKKLEDARLKGIDESTVQMRRYKDLVVQLVLLMDYVSETPIIHSSDSIIALTKYNDDSYGIVVDQTHLHLQGYDGNQVIVKQADRQFIEDNFIPSFIKAIDCIFKDQDSKSSSKWIMQRNNSKVNETRIDVCDVYCLDTFMDVQHNYNSGLSKTFGKKKDESATMKIMYIKSTHISQKNLISIGKMDEESIEDYCNRVGLNTSAISLNQFHWHFYSTDKNTDEIEHFYESISESALSEIVSPSILSNWIIESIAYFQLISTGAFGNQLPNDDEKDTLYHDVISLRGKFDVANSFYFDTRKNDYYVSLTEKNLCKFMYDSTKDVIYGLGVNDKSEFAKDEVSKEWLFSNFGESFFQQLKLQSFNNVTRFIEAPPGKVQKIESLLLNQDNPEVVFMQYEQRTCAFCSLASILHNFNYKESASYIYVKRNEFLQIKNNTSSQEKGETIHMFNNEKKRKFQSKNDIIKATCNHDWLHFIGVCMKEIKSEHHYFMKKINTSFDIISEINNLVNDDFILAGLRATDFSQEHAVCISKDHIFDSNFAHALSFSKENLDLICPPGFKCIYKGFYFNKGLNNKKKKINN